MNEIQEPGAPENERQRPRIESVGARKPCPSCGGANTVRIRSSWHRASLPDGLRCVDCGTQYGAGGQRHTGTGVWLIALLVGMVLYAAVQALLHVR
jgi:hypothetical protein